MKTARGRADVRRQYWCRFWVHKQQVELWHDSDMYLGTGSSARGNQRGKREDNPGGKLGDPCLFLNFF